MSSAQAISGERALDEHGRMYDMVSKVVIRSVRLEAALDHRVEELATARGQSVSAFIRDALTEASERDERRRRLERALKIAADLPDVAFDREAMWGLGTRVPR